MALWLIELFRLEALQLICEAESVSGIDGALMEQGIDGVHYRALMVQALMGQALMGIDGTDEVIRGQVIRGR
jgi:hypothetical protein